jgi:hypothetical protein
MKDFKRSHLALADVSYADGSTMKIHLPIIVGAARIREPEAHKAESRKVRQKENEIESLISSQKAITL